MSLNEPRDAKRALRTLLRHGRPHGDAAALVDTILSLALPHGTVVAGVWPLPGELSLIPAWDALHARGHPIVLPETTAPGEALRFRLWFPDAPLLPGRFGTRHPDGPAATPDIVFVPLLAWDRSMARLGYGGGYYDRTLASLRDALAIGYGTTAQEVAAVPVGPYDVPLDALVTERGVLTAEGRSFEDLVSGRHRRTERP